MPKVSFAPKSTFSIVNRGIVQKPDEARWLDLKIFENNEKNISKNIVKLKLKQKHEISAV